MYSLLSGFSSYTLDNRYIVFNYGCATSGCDQGDTAVYESWKPILLDMQSTSIEANLDSDYGPFKGCVLGSVPVHGRCYTFWLIHNGADVAVVADTYLQYPEVIPRLPVGWTMVRKLPTEIAWRTYPGGTWWDGMPLYFQDRLGLWSILNGPPNSTDYMILEDWARPDWTKCYLSGHVGDGCRRVKLYYEMSSYTGVAGTFYIRTPSVGGCQIVAVSDPGHWYNYGILEVQLSAYRSIYYSERAFEYALTGTAWARVYLREWQDQEQV